jgi:hypothetical protein
MMSAHIINRKPNRDITSANLQNSPLNLQLASLDTEWLTTVLGEHSSLSFQLSFVLKVLDTLYILADEENSKVLAKANPC